MTVGVKFYTDFVFLFSY